MAVAEPFAPPLQAGSVFDVVTDNADGAVRVTLAVTVHDFESETVTVYVPAPIVEIEAVTCPELHT